MPDGGSPGLDRTIRAYYDRHPEQDRLNRGSAQLEAARTRELIQRYLPAPTAEVVDVGGGAGAYAFWLAELGHRVHLLDPVPRLVEEARRLDDASRSRLGSCEVGDARALPLPDRSADVVLLLGPLYHLPDEDDRALALREAARVLRPGGLICAAGITRWASAFDGLLNDYFSDPAFAKMVAGTLSDGRHRNPTDRIEFFTTAYFHRPDELAREVERAGFALEGLFGVEGPGGLMADFDRRWADPRLRADLLRIAEAVETEPALLGVSAHILAVGRKPRSP